MKFHSCSIFIFLLLVSGGCGERKETRRTLYSFMEKEIVFPEKAFLVKNGSVSVADIEKERPVLVSFYGYSDCYECEIAHLNSKYSLFALADSLKSFHLLIIFAPEVNEIKHTLNDLEYEQFPFPVFVTLDDGWIRDCGIPKDRRFHTFLLDSVNHPVFVGDPTASPELMKLFKRRLINLRWNSLY